ncbi:class I SAM-dependent methyltransferase [Paenactinomyces guangxiensis]|uniref:Class I SAM-dependent methyltransferase n=1 Tax=Paenactinomyces guangxiensis TaxID=1490290 RepID=A0A7W1WRA6_9BACL|nr:class I SAM-dependent methyltransferase [Paenactinomyces guangxiensis]MBA4494441.1 class I SAM-dependent methyltransferase [Paenactinomyces guangxiensis]MBH8591504.1 class I SAM-dependent methyltransferase [Paenactinomyces guangxiensis]
MFVTTSFHPGIKELHEARSLASSLGVPFIQRERDSLVDLFARTGKKQVIIVTKKGWRYEDQKGDQFFFHPNMSALRIKHMMKGEPDALVASSSMEPGDQVLDCTLGMGADAIVSSFAVGEEGKVVALESQPVIAALVKQGLKTYMTNRKELNRAMRAIEVVQADYRFYLRQCPDRSFDIVYFDPMFRETVQSSAAMQMLKPIANPEPLDEDSVREAVRVAKKAVLLKERPKSGEFERLGFEIVKEASNYAWGVIRKKEGRDES